VKNINTDMWNWQQIFLVIKALFPSNKLFQINKDYTYQDKTKGKG
jgi:hypothetical protein